MGILNDEREIDCGFGGDLHGLKEEGEQKPGGRFLVLVLASCLIDSTNSIQNHLGFIRLMHLLDRSIL
ncbi:hypothetical protein L2E82_47412 [Cichorium intybus]|uniref:Uncharacterized protein n=1 Tax=Cichorium intybus TaxID=13427 RepID=A0ACB8YZK5_CICIN|nr:hypothetical protein L2E82_47412 [Cichorium intybus]